MHACCLVFPLPDVGMERPHALSRGSFPAVRVRLPAGRCLPHMGPLWVVVPCTRRPEATFPAGGASVSAGGQPTQHLQAPCASPPPPPRRGRASSVVFLQWHLFLPFNVGRGVSPLTTNCPSYPSVVLPSRHWVPWGRLGGCTAPGSCGARPERHRRPCGQNQSSLLRTDVLQSFQLCSW